MCTSIIWSAISITCEDPSAMQKKLTGFFKGRGAVDAEKKILTVRVSPERDDQAEFIEWCKAENIVFTSLDTAVVKPIEVASE